MDKQQRKFAEKMMAALRRSGWTGQIDLDEEQFRLVKGSENFLNLHNAYADWQQAGVLKKGEVIRRYSEGLANSNEPPESIDEARPNLVPRVRDLEWFTLMELQFADRREGRNGPAIIYHPLNDHLAVEVVYDWPQATSSLPATRLEEWGITLEEALRYARSNLRDRTQGTFNQTAPGVFQAHWGDSFDASRLLLTELISRLEVRGDPVVMLPHRDHLLITGSEDQPGLERVAETAEPLLSENRRITGRAFVWRDSAWQPFLPSAGHPLHDRFMRLIKITEANLYGDQKAALDELHRRQGNDVFVASVMLTSKPGEISATSLCTWTEGVHALLPRTDVLTFVRLADGPDKAKTWSVPWDIAIELVGDQMEAQGLVPERWLVTGSAFPTPEQLAPYARTSA